MNTSKTFKRSLLGAVCAALFFASAPASACGDSPNRPVTRAAQEALNPQDVNRMLIWVQLAGEAPIKAAQTGKTTGSVEPTRDVLAERIREAIAAQSREVVAVAAAHQR